MPYSSSFLGNRPLWQSSKYPVGFKKCGLYCFSMSCDVSYVKLSTPSASSFTRMSLEDLPIASSQHVF